MAERAAKAKRAEEIAAIARGDAPKVRRREVAAITTSHTSLSQSCSRVAIRVCMRAAKSAPIKSALLRGFHPINFCTWERGKTNVNGVFLDDIGDRK